MKVWPKQGVTVRDPVTQRAIEAGDDVPDTRFIQRRIADGDLSLEDPAVAGDKEHGVVAEQPAEQAQGGEHNRAERI